MGNEPITAAWLMMALIGVGASLIAYLGKRMLDEQCEKLDEHDRDITTLKVDVAKTQSSNEALSEQLRVLRHDVRDVKHGVDGISRHIMQFVDKIRR